MTDKSLTIIIVTFNSATIIKNCLEKLNFKKYQIIIVDNNSSDNTIDLITKHFPKADLIKLDKNIGYGRANNIALRQTNTDYALILNPDAFIAEKDIDKVINIMDKNQKFALAGPTANKISGFIETELIEGSILFLKMAIFRKIGFFDENFFLYYEDNELCKRSVKNGYKNIIIGNLDFWHLQNKSYQKNLRNIYKSRWHLRSWSKLYYKQITENKLIAKLMAVWLMFFYFVKILQSILRLKPEKIISYIAAFSGAFSYLIGLKAFRKNGSSRG